MNWKLYKANLLRANDDRWVQHGKDHQKKLKRERQNRKNGKRN
jgi:hypothetical protein